MLDAVADARSVTMVTLVDDLIAWARAAGPPARVAPDPADRSGIVMLPSDDPAREVRRLTAAGIVTDARLAHLRVPPYFYNERDDTRALVELLKP